MPYFLSLGAYLLLLWIFGLNELFTPGSIFVPHDTFYPVANSFWTTALGTFNSAFNYSNNIAALMVLTPDALIIGGLKFLFSNNTCQIIHIAVCLIVFHFLSFFSLNQIFKDSRISALLTLCYCFSPYSSILYSAGIIYQISTVVALGILPLFLFKLLTFDSDDIPLLIALTGLLAFGLLFIYPALLLILLTLLILWRNEKRAGMLKLTEAFLMPKNIGGMALLSLPFIFFIYLTTIIGSDKTALLAGGTSAAIKGGMFYPLMQISAWGLYDAWSPRAILSFHHYFFENPYRILSIILVMSLMYFLYRNKKYTPIYFALFLAFFAKGPTPPLGEIFSFVINYLPFGFMIRSPDSKFGAFIAAWFVVSIYFLPKNHKNIITLLAVLFLISNLFGMFANGAISSNRGDSTTTTFIRDSEAQTITGMIENHMNAVVIGNFPSCVGEWYEGKFHTCHGLISTSINRQFVTSEDSLSLTRNIALYESFPTLVILDKRQNESLSNISINKLPGNFEAIYQSENYSLYSRSSQYSACKAVFSFSCIKKDTHYEVSMPESAFRYYYPSEKYVNHDGILHVTSEPKSSYDTKRAAFIWLYSFTYLICLIFLFSSSMNPKKYGLAKPTHPGRQHF
jgi:hypothetical protein